MNIGAVVMVIEVTSWSSGESEEGEGTQLEQVASKQQDAVEE
jgi:hypothetical protein